MRTIKLKEATNGNGYRFILDGKETNVGWGSEIELLLHHGLDLREEIMYAVLEELCTQYNLSPEEKTISRIVLLCHMFNNDANEVRSLLDYLVKDETICDYGLTPEGQVAIQITEDSKFVLVIA